MKNYLGWGIGVVFLVSLSAISTSGAWNWFGSSAPADALNVNSVATDPGAYQGEIKVRGIVAQVSSADATFVLIDVREYRSCGVLSCATRFVTVHYPVGTLPQMKNEVLVTGEMVSAEQGYRLQTKTVQLLGE